MAETRKKRSEIALQDTWDAQSVYKDDAAWEPDFAKVEAELP